ncbi:uncharacterized protein BYT42DRAFT_584264 [Radiomyces spectabilis]|uniref:uncharacterized protein n=1 Tax=Radiomyces spectabilis TaxID=64574 RepID=UPI002220C224|nr:uncharacterized protein BYT42DRAFT_584264 [Radiomyces spectabilis]KAI8369395.1 hypothetical protein BYT42DRAFT_584264 [Radiomyces spectabilis]
MVLMKRYHTDSFNLEVLRINSSTCGCISINYNGQGRFASQVEKIIALYLFTIQEYGTRILRICWLDS